MSWRACAREPGGGEPVRGLTGEASRLVVERPELLSVPERLLEVVPDDLVLLLGALAADASDPRGEPSCRSARRSLGIDLVGGVPDQDVAESERLLAGIVDRSVRTSSLRISDRVRSGASAREVLGEQVPDGAGVELLADDRGALDGAALVLGQPFEAGGEERGDRRGNGDRREIARRDPSTVLP